MGEYQPLHDQDKDKRYSVPDEIEFRPVLHWRSYTEALAIGFVVGSVFASMGLFVGYQALLWNAAGFLRELPFMSKLHIHCGLK